MLDCTSVQTLVRQLTRFIRKQGDALNQVLALAVREGTPKTTNALENKNSLFKVFSRAAKYFPQPQRAQAFFAGIALMENFDVKRRGVHKGSSAMQRAGIDLTALGAHDFFSAVGLGLPQISLPVLTE
jgi:transposase-like protein